MQVGDIFSQNTLAETLMSREQKDKLEDILSGYNPENFTRDDLNQLRQELADAGIPRNGETLRIMRDAGFLHRPHHADAGQEAVETPVSEFRKSNLWGLYEQFRNGKISEAEFRARAGELGAGSLLRAQL
jgi:hypothetical protein